MDRPAPRDPAADGDAVTTTKRPTRHRIVRDPGSSDLHVNALLEDAREDARRPTRRKPNLKCQRCGGTDGPLGTPDGFGRVCFHYTSEGCIQSMALRLAKIEKALRREER